MEQIESPFRSPSFSQSHFRARTRPNSGSSVSSTENKSPSGYHSKTQAHHGGGGDENDPRASVSSSGSGYGDHRVNPFEKDVLAGLQRSFWSPSIMDIKDTPPQRSWNIEHLSHLFPKDIENSPSTHQNAFPIDDQTEAKAQADIDTYFSRGPIVPTPSPMKQNVSKLQYSELSKYSKTNISQMHCSQSPIARMGMGYSNSVIKKKKNIPEVDKWTQTGLSLPVELPDHIQEFLLQHWQSGDLCGPSDVNGPNCSQKSETSDQCDGVDNDSGKNSSSLNNSIRRRLDLSFGDEAEGESCAGLPSIVASPIVDPFRSNHRVNTPPSSLVYAGMNTTTSELEVQLLRCEFTPEARIVVSGTGTPAITPIQDEPDDARSLNASTPRRMNMNSKRGAVRMDQQFQWSPVEPTSIFRTTPMASNCSEDKESVNLRRCRVSSPRMQLKTSSASSFDDSQLMDDSSPPAKLHRRNSDKS